MSAIAGEPITTGGGTELKPCPFCGGQATTDMTGGQHFASCDGCGMETALWQTDSAMRDAWNRRPEPIPAEAPADKPSGGELREAVDQPLLVRETGSPPIWLTEKIEQAKARALSAINPRKG
jgi:Lar family restriction alleviation protein